ncbi:8-oxo-(d)GTP phosphatase [soil metagenome]
MSADQGAAVRASGGLVIRGAHDRAEICLVHRPAYDDWTIPKGKDDNGETPAQAALREVEEETGLSCVITGPAGRATYQVASGTKSVEYFLMRPTVFTGFTPNDEVDAIRWVALAKAPGILTYDFDRRLVRKVKGRSATALTALYLVRHGAAGDRSKWSGPDEERPLTKKGRAQAGVIADRLDQVGIEQVLSSPYVRCVETVADLASRIGLTVEPHDALAEGPNRKSIVALLEKIAGTTAVLCSHGDVIPATLESLERMGVRFRSEYAWAKGSTWLITHDGDKYCEARYLPPEL